MQFILFFIHSYYSLFWTCKTAIAARNWINSAPQTKATTSAFSSVFILLLCIQYIGPETKHAHLFAEIQIILWQCVKSHCRRGKGPRLYLIYLKHVCTLYSSYSTTGNAGTRTYCSMNIGNRHNESELLKISFFLRKLFELDWSRACRYSFTRIFALFYFMNRTHLGPWLRG